MKKVVFIILTVLLTISIFSSPGMTNGKVLVVHSYHAEYSWVQGLDTAIDEVLNSVGIQSEKMYMDTKRKTSQEWKIKSGQMAQEKMAAMKPAVVITTDDNAQAFFAKNFVGKNESQFVFCGLNADPEKYDFPAANVTGILERTYTDQTLDLLQSVVPSIQEVVYIADDSSTANLVTPRIQAQAKEGKLPIAVNYFERPSTFDQWQAVIKKYNQNASIGAYLIPLYHTVKKTAGGERVPPSEIMRWTVANTNKPVVGLWPFSTDDGALCAVVVDPKEHGHVAAEMAATIVSGKKAGDLKAVTNREGYTIFNLKTAEAKGIEIPFDILENANRIIE